MSRTPIYKVYNAAGIYQAAVKEPDAGAALLGALYPGGTIRLGHRFILYTDGVAGDSYDAVAEICYERSG